MHSQFIISLTFGSYFKSNLIERGEILTFSGQSKLEKLQMLCMFNK